MAALAQITDSCPFHTPSYAAACVAVGRAPWLLALWDGGRMVAGCLGVMRGRWPFRRMEIVTPPKGPAMDIFWSGVEAFCRAQQVVTLTVNTWAGEPGTVPRLPRELRRTNRTEFVLDLRHELDLSVNHRRNIGRARRSGLTVERTSQPEAARILVRLTQSSLSRRQRRGERVLLPDSRERRFLEALLAHHAGEVFRSTDGREVFSSALILRSGSRAYYRSSGTSPDGMRRGAAALVIWEASSLLKADGVDELNLGGAEDDGLRRFKSGFGAREVALEAASFAGFGSQFQLIWHAAQRFRQSVRA